MYGIDGSQIFTRSWNTIVRTDHLAVMLPWLATDRYHWDCQLRNRQESTALPMYRSTGIPLTLSIEVELVSIDSQ